jgi:WD40 repeat protein
MPGRIFAAAFSPDGNRIACGSSLDRTGQVWVYSCQYNAELPENIKAIEAKTQDKRSAEEKDALLKHFESNIAIVAKLEGQGGAVYDLAFSPDGKAIASAGFDGRVRLNEADTGKLIKEFNPVPLQETTANAN